MSGLGLGEGLENGWMLGVLNTGVKGRPRGTMHHAYCALPNSPPSHHWLQGDAAHPVLQGAEQ